MRPRAAACLVALAAALAAAGASPLARAGDGAAGPSEAELRLRIAAGPRPRDPASVRAWAAALAAEGRARAGTVLGGDCVAAAAAALSGPGADAAAALGLWTEAVAVYPAGVPEVGLAWYERGVLEARAGDASAGLAALDAAQRCAATPPPLDADADLRRRHARLRATMDGLGRSWRADLLERLGRFAEAADLHEALAWARGGGRGPGADASWERAARAAWRSGDRPRALEDVGRAIEAASDEERVATLEQWRLLAAHGRLDDRGDPRLSAAPADDAFLDDARGTLERLGGRRALPTFALRVASHLQAAGRAREAVDFYAAAFRDPGFSSGGSLALLDRQRLLGGASVAFEAGELERARDWCLLAERGAAGAVPGTSELLLEIDAALERRERDAVATGTSPARGEPGAGPRPSPPRVSREGLLVPSAPEAGASPAADVVAGVPRPPAARLPFGLLAAGLALAGALLGRRRRAAPR